MDKDAFINEICKKVQERLAVYENKPKLLILTARHGEICHQMLENPVLKERYQTECALLKEYCCDMDSYEIIVAYNLSNAALGKIANGIFDDDYTALFGQAILSGKKIYLPREEVELYSYCDKAPAAYYQRLLSNLRLLQDSGVIIAPGQELVKLILTGSLDESAKTAGTCPAADTVPGKEYIIAKHVITEKDVTASRAENAGILVVNKKAILTDLAKEYAHKQNMIIERREISSSGKG